MDRRGLVTTVAVLTALLVVVLAGVVTAPAADAHPGGTDGNGCHTCRTNCTEKWGIPYEYYHRHNPVRDCFETVTTTTATTTTRAPTTTTLAPNTTTTTRPPPTTTPTVGASVDLPPPSAEVVTYLLAMAALSSDIDSLVEDAKQINASWEARQADYDTTLADLRQLEARVEQSLTDFRREETPRQLSAIRDEALNVVGSLVSRADEMIAGLKAPDDGSARRLALASFEQSAADATQALSRLGEEGLQIGAAEQAPEEVTTTEAPTSQPTTTITAQSESRESADSPVPTGVWFGLVGGAVGYFVGRADRRQRNS